MLNIDGAVRLKTEDGCDVENDDGLEYAATEKLLVLFESSEVQHCESSEVVRIEQWPASYSLSQIEPHLLEQIESCHTKEEASRLKCDVNFCKAFLKPIIDDVSRYLGKDK